MSLLAHFRLPHQDPPHLFCSTDNYLVLATLNAHIHILDLKCHHIDPHPPPCTHHKTLIVNKTQALDSHAHLLAHGDVNSVITIWDMPTAYDPPHHNRSQTQTPPSSNIPPPAHIPHPDLDPRPEIHLLGRFNGEIHKRCGRPRSGYILSLALRWDFRDGESGRDGARVGDRDGGEYVRI
ncbi:hypothetical protein GRF29_164g1288241 [Pseudopithomyces chartarum]|uniref:Uncharacterized protein n=1 Tax=Pseudopithomyces chartarum TaxID=1892770 RepID=A0AAN6LPE1_9PLEO|nr:hypothetical protein GRF29_164g1288241 [Pseudopithomyces chartarum]